MQTRILEAKVTALSSIAHSGDENLGNETLLRRSGRVQPDGTEVKVPLVSGNSIRGKLRDLGMYHLCRAIGYGEPVEVKTETGENRLVPRGMPLAAFDTLFSGGALTKDAPEGLNLGAFRRLRSDVPLLSVFGCNYMSRPLPGKIKIHDLVLQCRETQHLLPQEFCDAKWLSCWDYVQREFSTRTDDSKNEKYRPMISGGAENLLAGEVALDAQIAARNKKQTAQQMIYYTETLSAGTEYYWKIVVDDMTDLEFEAFAVCLAQFLQNPYVGGKSGTGHGEVKIEFKQYWTEINSLVTETDKIGMPFGKMYFDFLRDNSEAIKDTLDSIR